MIVLALLVLFLVVTAVRSMVRVATRVFIVGIVVAVLFGVGVLQLPAGIAEYVPAFGEMARDVGTTITGLVTNAGVEQIAGEDMPELLANVTEHTDQSPD